MDSDVSASPGLSSKSLEIPLVRPQELEVDPIELVDAFPLRPMRCSLHLDQLRAGDQLAVSVGARQEDVLGVDRRDDEIGALDLCDLVVRQGVPPLRVGIDAGEYVRHRLLHCRLAVDRLAKGDQVGQALPGVHDEPFEDLLDRIPGRIDDSLQAGRPSARPRLAFRVRYRCVGPAAGPRRKPSSPCPRAPDGASPAWSPPRNPMTRRGRTPGRCPSRP
jgi:hypothetical protein